MSPTLSGDEAHRRPRSDPSAAPPPWTREDVQYAAAGSGWPRITLEDGTDLDGEAAWRAALTVADPEQLEALRAALPGADDIEDD